MELKVIWNANQGRRGEEGERDLMECFMELQDIDRLLELATGKDRKSQNRIINEKSTIAKRNTSAETNSL